MELDGQVRRSSARALCWRWHGIKVRLCEDDTWRFLLRLPRLDESTRPNSLLRFNKSLAPLHQSTPAEEKKNGLAMNMQQHLLQCLIISTRRQGAAVSEGYFNIFSLTGNYGISPIPRYIYIIYTSLFLVLGVSLVGIYKCCSD